MPVVRSGTPTVTMSVPVPTPVQSKPKSPPVSFGGEDDTTQPQQPTGATGVPPARPPKRQLTSVILPWSPPPKSQSQPTQLRRKVVRYAVNEHRGFLKRIAAGDLTARKVFADFLEERGEHGSPETLDTLRNSDAPIWVTKAADGKYHAGRKWTMAAIRHHDRSNGGHWFDPSTVRFFGTRIHGEPIHGPGGVFFVTSERSGFDHASPRRFTVRQFKYNQEDPGSSDIGTADGEELGDHVIVDTARLRAKELAAQVPTPPPTEPAPAQLSRRVVRYSAPNKRG